MKTQQEERLGSYVLGDRLGRGASGVVRQATSSTHDEPVVVKLLRDEFVDDERTVARFLREKRIISSVDHPNVVKVHDLVVEEQQLGIVMEYVDGGDLRTLISTNPPTTSDAIDIARQVADGLAHLHQIGVLHRDLKPANVLMGGGPGSWVAKIADFGVSWLVGETMTRMTTTVGTPRYMAPEISDNRGAVESSDVYALGIMLFELLTGSPPFHGNGPVAIIMAHVRNPVPRLRDVPEGLSELVSRMLAKDPANRPAAAEVATELRALAPLVDDEMTASVVSPLPFTEPVLEEAPPTVMVPAAVPAVPTSTAIMPARPPFWMIVSDGLRRRVTPTLVGLGGLVLLGGLVFATTRNGPDTITTEAAADEAELPIGPSTSQQPGGGPVTAAGDGDSSGSARFSRGEPATGSTTTVVRTARASRTPTKSPTVADDRSTVAISPSVSADPAVPVRSEVESAADPATDTVSDPAGDETSTVASGPLSGLDDGPDLDSEPATPVIPVDDGPTTEPAPPVAIVPGVGLDPADGGTSPATGSPATSAPVRTEPVGPVPLDPLPTTTTTVAVTTTTRATTTTKAPTTTIAPPTSITTVPSTTTTEKDSPSDTRDTDPNQVVREKIEIVAAPSIVSVGSTSAVFTYTTNDVCGTGSFTYRKQSTDEVVGRWTGDRGCFGPRHNGSTAWPGLVLEPDTTYVVDITVEGQPGNGVLPTGIGRDKASIIITTDDD